MRTRWIALVIFALALGLTVAPASAAVLPGDSAHVSPNTLTAGYGSGWSGHALAFDPVRSRHLAVWGTGSYFGGREMHARLLGADGEPAGPEVKLGDVPRDDPAPSVAYNVRTDEFLVTWTEASPGDEQWVRVRRVSSDGIPLGTERLLAHSRRAQGSLYTRRAPASVGASVVSGRYLVTWADVDDRVMGQWLTPSGDDLGEPFVIATDAFQGGTALAHDPVRDEFLVVWDGEREILGTRLSGPAEPVAAGVPISHTPDRHDRPRWPAVAYDEANGGYLAVWMADHEVLSTVRQLYGQRLEASGAPESGSDFRISDERLDQSSGASLIDAPQLAASPDGTILALWRDVESGYPYFGARLYAQELSAEARDAPAPDVRVSEDRPPDFEPAAPSVPALAAGSGTFVELFRERRWQGGNDPAITPPAMVARPLVHSVAQPDATITSGPPESSTSQRTTVAFEGNADAHGFDCRLDGTDWEPCSSPWQGDVADGRHSFEVRARAMPAGVDPTPAMHRWTVESEPPDTRITKAPAPLNRGNSLEIEFESSEDARFECRLDAGAWEACKSDQPDSVRSGSYAPSYGVGPHRFEVRAIDITGAPDPSPAAAAWVVDGSTSQPVITRAPTGRLNRASASVEFTSPNPDASFTCEVNGVWRPCTSPLRLTGLPEGRNDVNVRATDATGATWQARNWFVSWYVDTTAPDTKIDPGPEAESEDRSASFVARGSAFYECRLDVGAWSACPMDSDVMHKQYDGLALGEHTFELRASDDLGNTDATPASHTWTVVEPGPRTRITHAPGVTSSHDVHVEWVADEPDATFECRVRAGDWRACESPLDLHDVPTGYSAFEVRATAPDGRRGLHGASTYWFAGSVEPDTRFVSGPASPQGSSTAAYRVEATRSITYARTECRLDGGQWDWCSGLIGGLADGPHRLEARSIDLTGLVETTPAAWEWTVQTRAPQTTIGYPKPSTPSGPSGSFTFSSDDPAATFECEIDGAGFSPCSSPAPYSGLATGEHVFRARARDAEGRADLAPDEHRWTVDAERPDTSITMSAPVVGSTDRSFSLRSTKGAGTFRCRMDAEEWRICQATETYRSLAEGPHVLEASATDAHGNTDTSAARFEFNVDVTPPDTTLTAAPSGRVHTSTSRFEFSSGDSAAKFQCAVDTEGWDACSSPQDRYVSGNGDHGFKVWAVDPSGNVDATPAEAHWVSAAVPTVELRGQPAAKSTSTTASFSFAAAGDAATFDCRLDGPDWSPCSSPAAYTGLTEGDHEFAVRGVDSAGEHDSQPVVVRWTIDSLSPNTALVSKPRLWGSSTTAHFELASTKPDSTFECSVDGAGWSACDRAFDLTDVAEGRHAIEARAVTADGHRDPTPSSAIWWVDTVAPDTRVVSRIADGMRTSRTDARFSGRIIGLRPDEYGYEYFHCSVDGAPWTWCRGQLSLTGLADGPHSIELAAADGALNLDPTPVRISWTVDRAPAETTIDEPPTLVEGDRDADVRFSSPTEGASFECRMDGGTWRACESPHRFTGLGDGVHKAEVRAQVRGRFDESPAAATWVVDGTPETRIAAHPARLSNSTAFQFASDESRATFECSIDGGLWEPCLANQSFDVPDGEHTLAARAVDATAHIDPTPAEWTWTVDRTPPRTTISSAPAEHTALARATLTFEAEDDSEVVFDCRLDSGRWEQCESPWAAGEVVDGAHTADVRATDRAGNVEASPPRASWTVDRRSPRTEIPMWTSPVRYQRDTNWTIEFTAWSSDSTYECRLDRSDWSACSSPKKYEGLAEGRHDFRVRAVDGRGVRDETPAETWVVVDRAAPDTRIEGGPPEVTEDRNAYFGLTANDGGDFQCQVDSAAWARCDGLLALRRLADGAHTLLVRAVDEAGNADPTPATRRWTVDNSTPETTIDSAPSSPTTSVEARLEFHADESPVRFECALDAAEWGECSSPASYGPLGPGEHEFRVRAVDRLGHADASPAVARWTVEEPPSGGGDPGTGTGTGGGDPGTGTGGGGDPDPGTSTGPDPDPGTGTGGDPDPDPGTGTGGEQDPDPGTGTGGEQDPDPGTGKDPDPGTGKDPDPGTGKDPDPATGQDTPAGSDIAHEDTQTVPADHGDAQPPAQVETPPPPPRDPVARFLSALVSRQAAALTRGGLMALTGHARPVTAPRDGVLTQRVLLGRVRMRGNRVLGSPRVLATSRHALRAGAKRRVALRVSRAGARSAAARKRTTVTLVSWFDPAGDAGRSVAAVAVRLPAKR